MASPRRFNVELQLTSYFHCTSRCVRGSYLCGKNRTTGVDHTHRREWLTKRLLFLAECFAIKLAAFTVMENHFHVVLRVEKSTAQDWSDKEVITRWHKLFKGSLASQRYLNSEELSKTEKIKLDCDVARWRRALQDISWFMRCAKEPIARLANKEDNCKGRFWEGRFHSQALLDKKAVIACMTYVDLNPVRAKMHLLPEADLYSSFRLRTMEITNSTDITTKQLDGLVSLTNNSTHSDRSPPIDLRDYVNLVDTTARHVKPGKRGLLPDSVIPILKRIGITSVQWPRLATTFNTEFYALVGCRHSLMNACKHLHQRNAWGQRQCHVFFDT